MASRGSETQPGTLLLTMTIPPHRVNRSQNGEIDYLPYLPQDFDLQNYEVACAHGFGSEEFDWGLYWYKNSTEGIWFTLQKVSPPMRDLFPAVPPVYALFKYTASIAQLRLSTSVVGLIRVLTVPPSADFADHSGGDFQNYLEWLTANMAITSTRTCVWAVGAFVRCRQHIARIHDLGELPPFDITAFLREALTFAYAEVWYALGGQLPRPIMISVFGSSLIPVPAIAENDGKENDATNGTEDRLVETEGPKEDQEEEWPALPSQN